jgi:uncharacterized protein YjiS (DUF1127 family)
LRDLFRWRRTGGALYRKQRTLFVLDVTMLKDIGISRTDAMREGRKPFWRP